MQFNVVPRTPANNVPPRLFAIELNFYLLPPRLFEIELEDFEILAVFELKKMLIDRMVHLLTKGKR